MQHNGSATSLKAGLSLAASLTRAQSLMLERATLRASLNAISSRALADGRSLRVSRGGRTITRYGQARVRVNRSHSPEAAKASTTPATSGQNSAVSLASDALQSFLENRLRVRLRGSDLCEVIWKPWNTPWGQCLSRPRARVRTTSATDIGLWATIRATDGAKGGPNMQFGAGGQPLPAMAAWATPAHRDYRYPNAKPFAERGGGTKGEQLPNQAAHSTEALWPTPTSLAPARDGNNEAGNSAGLVAIRKHALAVEAALYPTPSVACATGGQTSRSGDRKHEVLLTGLAASMEASLWSTARSSANENRQTQLTPSQLAGKHGLCLAGLASHGSSEQTEKRGALNPAFVCWLMGYPAAWVSCADSATQSTRVRRPNLSALISTASARNEHARARARVLCDRTGWRLVAA